MIFLARTAANYREARSKISMIKFIIGGIFGNNLHARTEVTESESLSEYFYAWSK